MSVRKFAAILYFTGGSSESFETAVPDDLQGLAVSTSEFALLMAYGSMSHLIAKKVQADNLAREKAGLKVLHVIGMTVGEVQQ
jgi:hypothetical protein